MYWIPIEVEAIPRFSWSIRRLPPSAISGRYPVSRRPFTAPDGSLLYVCSGLFRQDSIFVMNTATGEVLNQALVGWRIKYKLLPYVSALAVSPGGKWVYVSKMVPGETGPPDKYTIAVFDARTLRQADEFENPVCGPSQLIAGPNDGDLSVHCRQTNSLRRFRVSELGKLADVASEIELPLRPRVTNGRQNLPPIPIEHERSSQA
jgi:hypothetical protein